MHNLRAYTCDSDLSSVTTVGNQKDNDLIPLSLDLANECLRQGSQSIKLRPKTFAMLNYLLSKPGILITKEELLSTVWSGTFVGEAVLKVAIREIRQALGDDPKSPRFIETAHRRGYRFIGQVTQNGQTLQIETKSVISTSQLHNSYSNPSVLERYEELALMERWLKRALGGERQLVFVTGEAGIGKTALVDAFAQTIANDRNIRIGRGQCLEQYGTGEPYLPLLEAIGRLCKEQEQIVDTLRVHAPMWLLQMPSVVNASDRELLSREVFGATRERMLREMGEALEVLTSDKPLVLILEDLHWSDCSTLDLISYLARQRQPARLMVIGTYRPVELVVSGHPLKAVKQELFAKQQCEQLPLEYLSEHAVANYLNARFPINRFPAGLSGLIHQRTDGNPLFMVNVVDYLLSEGLVVELEEGWELTKEVQDVQLGVPDSIKQMIEKQLEHLDPDEQRTLEAASVAGPEFSELAVVAGLNEDRALVEARCAKLARQHHFIQDCGAHVLPNGEAVSRYGFIHDLYRHVLYERVSASKRVQLHRRIGERGEEVYGNHANEIAAELAMHFELGSNHQQAVRYLKIAAENAQRRFAYREAIGLARGGLALLSKLPNTRERTEQELSLQLTLGVPLIVTGGYAATEVGSVYMKARELCQQLGETPDVSEVLWGLWTFHTLRAEFGIAREIAEEFLRLAERLRYDGLAMRGHWALEITFMHLGEFSQAMEHFEKALSLYDHKQHLDDAFLCALNPGVAMRCFAALALWFLGHPDQALELVQEALVLARELSEPHSLAHALFFEAIVHHFRDEVQLAQQHAEATIALSCEHGLVFYQAMATVLRAWALSKQGRPAALEEMNQGLSALQATSTQVLLPHFLALKAEVLDQLGQIESALHLSHEAIEMAHRTGERYYESELYRIKGELALKQSISLASSRAATMGSHTLDANTPGSTSAISCFNQSIKVAQRQKAKTLELRALTSLVRTFKNRNEPDQEEAKSLLTQVFDNFTEGFSTTDLREAAALVDELSVVELGWE